MGAWTFSGGFVSGIAQWASAEGEATAADTAIELIPEGGEAGDAIVEVIAPTGGEDAPFLSSCGAVIGKGIECILDLFERDASALGGLDDGNAAKDVAGKAALVPFCAPAVNQPLRFVKVDGRNGDTAAFGNFSDGEFSGQPVGGGWSQFRFSLT